MDKCKLAEEVKDEILDKCIWTQNLLLKLQDKIDGNFVYPVWQVLDEIGVDVASQVGISCY